MNLLLAAEKTPAAGFYIVSCNNLSLVFSPTTSEKLAPLSLSNYPLFENHFIFKRWVGGELHKNIRPSLLKITFYLKIVFIKRGFCINAFHIPSFYFHSSPSELELR